MVTVVKRWILSRWGHIYGAIVLLGILIHEQTEGSRRRGRHVAHVGSQSLLNNTGHFVREWLAFENIQLVVIMIGVALCVPTEVSPIAFAQQTLCRTLILGALACLWIHA